MSFFLDLDSKTITPVGLALLYLTESVGGKTFIPELFGFFADEGLAMKFFTCFAGRTLKIPSKSAVQRAFKYTQAYLRCKELSEKNAWKDVVMQVGTELGMSGEYVVRAWRGVARVLAQLDKDVRQCLAENPSLKR